MKKFLNSKYLETYKPILFIQTVLFLPFLIDGSISADWDSYASLASGKILFEELTYIPSRPPGFPLYELLLGVLSTTPTRFTIFFHYLVGLFFTIYIYKSLPETKLKPIYAFIFFTSSVYLISAYTAIDYVLGAFFGFAFLNKIREQKFVLAYFLIIVSCGIRLSNVIFLIAGCIFLYFSDKDSKKIAILITSLIPIIFLYLPSYLVGGGVCFLNLTNIDHNLYERLGRYFYKQIQFFGILGSLILIFYFFKHIRKIEYKDPFHLSIIFIFISFQLSFLRLPTEKGHLLPALICFLFLINNIEIKRKFLYLVLISSLLSNFFAIEFLKPDIPNHATSAEFSIFIDDGYLVKDFKIRADKGKNFEYNISNSVSEIKNAWSKGAPNC